MNLFLFAALCLIGITVLMLLRPWQRTRADNDATVRELNARIYRDQLAELDRDLSAGTLAAADHAQARAELQRRLLDDTAQAGASSAPAPARHTSLVLALALPVAATGLYALLGAPAALQPQAVQEAADNNHAVSSAEIEKMVAGLAARLEKNPGDVKGWVMLARSYRAMGKLAEAEAAFGRVGDAINGDAELLAEYADTLASRSNGEIEGRPLQLVKAALKLDGNHPMALSLAATAAYKRQDFPEAARYWRHLLKQLPPESDDAQWLVKTLAEIGAPVEAAAAAPAAEKVSTTAQATAGTVASISGSVTLSPKLQSAVQPTDTVFVFARATDGARMPLAVQRARVADLPLQFKLDDSMALSPQAKLSDAKQVRIEVRVSRNGSATPSAGDLIGTSPVVNSGATQVALQIDQVRP